MYHCLVVMRPEIALVLKPELVPILTFIMTLTGKLGGSHVTDNT